VQRSDAGKFNYRDTAVRTAVDAGFVAALRTEHILPGMSSLFPLYPVICMYIENNVIRVPLRPTNRSRDAYSVSK
jgi:hypothetical protein